MFETQYSITFNYSSKQQEKFLQSSGATLTEKVKNFIPEGLPDDGSREFFALTTLAQIPRVFPDYFERLPKNDPCVRWADMAQMLRKLYHGSNHTKIDPDLVWQTVAEAMHAMGLNPNVKKNVIEKAVLTPTAKELKRAEKELASLFKELSTFTPAQLVHLDPDGYIVARLGIFARNDKHIASAYDYFFGKSLNPSANASLKLLHNIPEEFRQDIYLSVLSYCLISARNEIQNHETINPDDVRLTVLIRDLIGILYNPAIFIIEMAYWTNNAKIKHALVHPDVYLTI